MSHIQSLMRSLASCGEGSHNPSRAEDPGFESRLRRDFFGVESFQ